MSDREQVRNSIIERLAEIKNDNVLRSIILVMGDYAVSENGEERANYITAILFSIIGCTEIKSLSKIYSFAKAFEKIEAEKAVQYD